MSMNCSLRGHNFGEPEIREESETRNGGEIIVEKKIKECVRCDTEKVMQKRKTARAGQESSNSTNQSKTTMNNNSTTETDSTNESSSEDGGIILDETGSTDKEEPESELDPNAFGAKRDAPDVGPENNTNNAQPNASESPSSSKDASQLIPESEKQDVEIMGTPDSEQKEEETVDSPQVEDSNPREWEAVDEEDDALACPECDFKLRKETEPIYAGDACPECRRGYLVE